MSRGCWLLASILLMLGAGAGEAVIEGQRLRLAIGEDATWRSVADKAAGKELCAQGKGAPLASVRIGDSTHRAQSARMEPDGQLALAFEGCDTRLVYAVEALPDWILFRLERIEGTRPSHVTLLSVPVAITQRVGRRLAGAWDDELAVCLMAANLQTQCSASRRAGFAELAATTQDAPGPKLEGASAALVACPTKELDAILQKLAVACGLPRNDDKGTPSRLLPIARQSYWFLTFGEKDADRVIALCKQSGFRQVMMNSGSWCRTVGHYTFNTANYPDGIESLRRTVARLHEAGILVGMHCFASKVSKTDAYVTPVPDPRFWVDLSATLATDVGAGDDTVRTSSDLREWPGSPVAKQKIWEGGVGKHQEVIIGDEVIRYKAIGPEGKWDTFLGCERGAWGTKAAPHKAGALCRHYGVDGCINGYIIDQETTLLDETTTRLAHVFNTCGFDMVYFDGGEDVDRRRFNYYVANFQAVAMGKFTKRPLVHMGTIMTHGLIHSFTRSGTVDTYLNTLHGHIIAGGKLETWPTVKSHIDRSVAYMLSVGEDRIPGELGWFGIWPKGKNTDGLQLDEIEYLMCKSLAHDAPISLQASFAQMERHPLTPGILEIVRAYEELRLAGKVPEETRKRLGEKGREYLLFMRPDGPEFVEVQPAPQVAGGSGVRAVVGKRGGSAVASVWHHAGVQGKLTIPTHTIAFGGMTAAGSERTPAGEAVPIGARREILSFAGLEPEDVRKLLAASTFEPRKPLTLWLQAEDAARIVGTMAKGSATGIKEEGAFGDMVLCTTRPNRAKPEEGYCEYRVEIPHEGRWTLWARVRYPSGSDDSFGIAPAGEKVTLDGNQVLGNCGLNERKWHWTGRGGGSTTPPPGQPIAFTLPRGPFVFRIYPREGAGTIALHPRLDLLCLSDDPSYIPTDADARKGLAGLTLASQ